MATTPKVTNFLHGISTTTKNYHMPMRPALLIIMKFETAEILSGAVAAPESLYHVTAALGTVEIGKEWVRVRGTVNSEGNGNSITQRRHTRLQFTR